MQNKYTKLSVSHLELQEYHNLIIIYLFLKSMTWKESSWFEPGIWEIDDDWWTLLGMRISFRQRQRTFEHNTSQ